MIQNSLNKIRSLSVWQIAVYAAMFLMCFTFTILDMQIHRFPLYFWFALVAAGVILLSYIAHFEIRLPSSKWLAAVMTVIMLSLIPAYVCKDLPEDYYYHVHGMPWRILMFYFLAGYVEGEVRRGTKILDLMRRGIKAGIVLELFWIALQYVLYSVWGFDLNTWFFKGILGRVYTVNMIYVLNDGIVKIAPSGMTWHSAYLIPMFILGLLMFDNFWVRVLILFEAFVCRSSTALVGSLMTAGLLFIYALIKGRFKPAVLKEKIKKVKLWQWIIAGLVIAAAAVIAVRFGVFSRVIEESGYLVKRFRGLFDKNRTPDIHFRYFGWGIYEWSQANLLRKLLGFGYYGSGFPIEKYNELLVIARGSAVECDYINILLSHGIIGFTVYYGWLIASLIRGLKTDHRYFIFIAAMLVCGIGYNAQWEYTIFIEFVMYLAAKNGKSLFADRKPGAGPFPGHSSGKVLPKQ